MEKTQLTVAELSSLLRMIQVIPDADNVGRIQQVLLAFCTAWRTIGVRRAFLFVVDERSRTVRGHLAAERASDEGPGAEPETFEALARRVVDTTQQIDTNDLTLRTRAFTVPLDWLRCGLVKAVDSGMPTLADRRLTEFASDPFFEFFQTPAYVAVPLRVHGRITAVLAADNGEAGESIGLEDISLVYSMSQQAATAIERLLDSTDNSRKFRVLRKLQEVLASAEDSSRFGDSLSAMLSMTARAAGGTGVLLKDLVRNKTTHVKSVDDLDDADRDTDISITESFEEILDRVAGSTRPLRGDSGHALLTDAAAGAIQHFVAVPLLAGGDCLGAVAVYTEADGAGAGPREFSARDRLFLELCAGMLAERLDSLYKADRLRRSERMLEEAQSNWIREKLASRASARALEQYDALINRAREIRQAVDSRSAFEKRVERVREILDRVESEAEAFRLEADVAATELEMVDVFKLTKELVEVTATKLRAAGVEVTIRIPGDGPTLLMHRASVRGALDSVVRVLAEHVGKGDRVLFECSASAEKAVLLFADTAGKVDGTLLSRLFLPFAPQGQEPADTMALAGDILQRHAGEITVKSSASWKTILAITFPISANRDRRNTRSDRRRRPRDRRDRP